jgi:LysR family transcriptional regulator, cyn operon transcriptional activator
MTLQQLRYLIAFADHATMTAAALSMPVAQPVLTRALRGLERELEISLFRRDGRGLTLTENGRDAVAIARRILAATTELTAISDSRACAPERPTIIATTPSIEEIFGDRIAVAVGGPSTPPVEFRTTDDPTHAVAVVLSGEADLGIVDERVLADGLRSRYFTTMSAGLMCPIGHLLPTPVPRHQLAELPLIATRRGTPRRVRIDEFFATLGFPARVVRETGDRAAWPSLVRSGHGYALWYSEPNWPAPAGVVVEALDPPVTAELRFVHRPPTHQRAEQRLQTVIDQCRSAVG